MELTWRAVSAVARIAVWVGAALLFAAAAIVSAEVFSRKGLGTLVGPQFVFSGSDEISAYLFAVGTSLSMAHVLVTRGHSTGASAGARAPYSTGWH
jgi:TRAP-type C4-dicarboxylate transport system permease small subunit